MTLADPTVSHARPPRAAGVAPSPEPCPVLTCALPAVVASVEGR